MISEVPRTRVRALGVESPEAEKLIWAIHSLGHVAESEHFGISGFEGTRVSQDFGGSNPRNAKGGTSELGIQNFGVWEIDVHINKE
jgi:hypothetical protein